MGPQAHPHPALQRDAPDFHGVVLLEELDGIQDHAVTQEATLLGVENPRGDLVEDEFLIPHVDRVAGIGPSLVAGDDVGFLGQDVHDLPLTLVSPLPAHDHGAATSIQACGHGAFGSFNGSGSGCETPTGGPGKRALPGEGPWLVYPLEEARGPGGGGQDKRPARSSTPFTSSLFFWRRGGWVGGGLRPRTPTCPALLSRRARRWPRRYRCGPVPSAVAGGPPRSFCQP